VTDEDAPARYQLDAVVAHVAACSHCARLLDASAATRDPDARAAFDATLGRHLAARLRIVPRESPR
jgi:hypothetical protein